MNMKHFHTILFTMVAIIFFSACTKEDFYYVKYDANVVLNDGEELGIDYKTADGKIEHYVTTSENPFSVTIGPVSKGFVAYMDAVIRNHELDAKTGGLYVWISVSKNNGQFGTVKQVGGQFCLGTNRVEYTVGE